MSVANSSWTIRCPSRRSAADVYRADLLDQHARRGPTDLDRGERCGPSAAGSWSAVLFVADTLGQLNR